MPAAQYPLPSPDHLTLGERGRHQDSQRARLRAPVDEKSSHPKVHRQGCPGGRSSATSDPPRCTPQSVPRSDPWTATWPVGWPRMTPRTRTTSWWWCAAQGCPGRRGRRAPYRCPPCTPRGWPRASPRASPRKPPPPRPPGPPGASGT